MKMLAADIGGTKSWLCLVETKAKSAPRCLFEQQYPSTDFSHLSDLIQHFLNAANAPAPECIALALPGVIQNTPFYLTNLNWLIDYDALMQSFQPQQLYFYNDFSAVAAGIVTLKPSDYLCLNPAPCTPEGVCVVTGAGTGLGQAWLLNNSAGSQHFATEGGHIDFAANTEQQWALRQYLQAEYGHVSYERLLSGAGLVALYHFLSAGQASLSKAEQVSQLAARGDVVAEAALDLFIEIYGAFIGNLALLYRPQAGIYIAGGIVAKLQTRMQSRIFMDNALAKGRMRGLVEQSAIYLVTNQRLGLQGVIQASMATTGEL